MPRTAVAAATAGDTRWVRAPLPCRPSKFRLDVDAQRSPGARLVGIHPQAHRATGVTPLRACGGEDLVQILGFGLLPNSHGAWDDQHPHTVGDPTATQNLSHRSQVFDTTVGTRTDKDGIHRDVAHRRSGTQVHAGQSLLSRLPVGVAGHQFRVGYRLRQRNALTGVGSPGYERAQSRCVDVDFGIELCAVIGSQHFPRRDCRIPVSTGRRVGPATQKLVRGLVGATIPARAPASMLMLQIVIRPSIESDSMVLPRYSMTCPLAAAGTDLGDHRQDDVLGGDPLGSWPSTLTAIVLNGRNGSVWVASTCSTSEVPIPMANAPNAPCVDVWLSPHDRHAGLGEAWLRSHHVDDALFPVSHGMQADAELSAVAAQRLHLGARHRVGNRFVDVHRRHVVVLGSQGQIGSAHRASRQSEAVEGLGTGDLVNEVQVDVDRSGSRAAPEPDPATTTWSAHTFSGRVRG